MTRRRHGTWRVDWCLVCMAPSHWCTCGAWGTPAAPGADRGGHLARRQRTAPETEPLAEAPVAEPFGFETIDEYREGGELGQLAEEPGDAPV